MDSAPVMNNFSDNIKKAIESAKKRSREAEQDAEFIAVGKRVRVLRTWRDQAVGHSRTDQKGKVFTVRGVGLDGFSGPYLFIGDFRFSIPLDSVEFLE